MGRKPCCEKVGLKKGRWTAEEDEILAKYIKENGEGLWRSLPKNAGLLRCGKSCRLRWINYLRSDLKRGNFSVNEEDMIVKLRATLGNRWSLIASYLPGRTDNEIKNYWNSHLCRNIQVFRRAASSDALPAGIDAANIAKRRGSRTQRRRTRKNSCSNYAESSLLWTCKTVNKDVPHPSTAAPTKEYLVGIDDEESNREKDSYGKPFVWSCCGGKRETETSIEKETQTVEAEGSCGSSMNGCLLGFNDLLKNGSIDVTEGYLAVVEEIDSCRSMEEKEYGQYCHNQITLMKEVANRSDNINGSDNIALWQSLFSLASSFDDSEIWEWEKLVQVEEQRREDEMTILPSLWVEDDWTSDSRENDKRRNLVSWLLH